MGGIAAILGYDGRKSKELITKICAAMKHRGPDDFLTFLDSKLTLGNVVSLTNSSARSDKPLCNKDNCVWITFDGYLSPNSKLKLELNSSKSVPASDAEIVLYAYSKYGERFIDHIDGFFAFCLWDSLKNQLICARDRFGVKPLYYFKKNNAYIFASELKAFFVDPVIPSIPNHALIHNFLLKGAQYRNGETFFDGIKEILPAHYLNFDLKKNKCLDIEYWHPAKAPLPRKKNANYPDEFQRIFRRAIQELLPNTGLFATSMAGLDSQAIASVVDEEIQCSNGHKHFPISAIFQNATVENNEEPYIREYARFHRTKVEYVRLPDSLTWADLKDFVYNAQEPCSLSCYVYWSISRVLKERGVRVAFLGIGADPLLWGLDREVKRYFGRLWQKKEIGTLIIEFIGSLVQRDLSSNLLKRILEEVRNNVIPASIVFDDSQFLHHEYLSHKFAIINNNSIDQLRGDILGFVLETDRLFWGNSVEPRHPFLYRELVDFILSLPPNQKVRLGVKKSVLRKAMKGHIPDSVRKCKRKFPTPVPIVDWLTGLRPEIIRMLTSETFRTRKIFNETKILEKYTMLCEGKLNLTEIRRFTELLWRIISLELWLELYIDKKCNKITPLNYA